MCLNKGLQGHRKSANPWSSVADSVNQWWHDRVGSVMIDKGSGYHVGKAGHPNWTWCQARLARERDLRDES